VARAIWLDRTASCEAPAENQSPSRREIKAGIFRPLAVSDGIADRAGPVSEGAHIAASMGKSIGTEAILPETVLGRI